MLSVTSRRAAVSVSGNDGLVMGLTRWVHHATAQPAPFYGVIAPPDDSPALVLPEFSYVPDKDAGYGLPSFGIGGSMELMAVPKKKVSPHKRGIRNGPKALKPQPIIIRCKLLSFKGRCETLRTATLQLYCGRHDSPMQLYEFMCVMSCGRVKLQHFYCCSGDRGNNNEQHQ